MKITLACNARLPSERAHPLQVVRMWQAFNALPDVSATLLYPFRFQREKPLRPYGRRFWKWYGMEESCGPNVRLPTLDAVHILDLIPSLVGVYSRVQQSSFSLALAAWLMWKRDGCPLWSREILSLPVLSALYPGLPVFYEMHRFPGSHVERQVRWLRGTRGVICITEGLKQRLIVAGHPEEHILVVPDGVALADFKTLPTCEEARRQLNIGAGRHAVYTGHLYAWKGIDTAIDAVRSMTNLTLHVVGGMSEDQEALRSRFTPWPDNVILQGHRPPTEIPLWLRAADVIVVPNSANQLISREYTSPLKLFEAMASGTPLVVSDLPSLREVVDERLATLVTPDDPEALRHALEQTLQDATAVDRAALAVEHAKGFSWVARAEQILEFIQVRL